MYLGYNKYSIQKKISHAISKFKGKKNVCLNSDPFSQMHV